MDKTTHVAILPTPGMGHLIPLVEFAKRLIDGYNFSFTLILPTDGPLSKAHKEFVDSLPAGIDHVLLPPVNFDDLADDVRVETRIALTISRSLPAFRDAFKTLVDEKKVAALVIDLFGTDGFDVAIEFGVSPFIFFPSTAMALSLFLHLSKLDAETVGEYRDQPEPIRIPGCIPIQGKDMLDPVQDRKNDAYKWLLHHAGRYKLAEGIMVNSFREVEPGPITALLKKEPGKPPIYPVGPLIKMSSNADDAESECLKWLNGQPSGSVLFVSFGSGGTLSSVQLNELAMGLEMSEQRFIWVVRSPNDGTSAATYFNVNSQTDPYSFLPEGFVGRTRGRGLLVPSWAPQAAILSHGSTGGFLTHCGWNSTLESVYNGVPLIAWPLYAEQRMNAVMLTEDLKVALRPKTGENGIVGRLEIANVVKGLMEGEEGKGIRSRMRDLKDAAAKAIGEDGASTKALSEVACIWKNKIN